MRNLFMVLFLGLTLCARAGDPVKELLRKALEGPKYPNDNQLVIFDSTQVEVQESGLTHVVSHTLTLALTQSGAQEAGVIKFGYDPLSAYVEVKKAVIHRKDGTEIPLELSRVTDYPAPARAIYWGAREVMLDAGRIEPGDAVEVVLFRKGFTYALLAGDDDERYIPPMRGQFYDIVEFFSSHPVLSKVYRVSVPGTKRLQFQFYNGECTTSAWMDGDRMVYAFSKRNMMPIKSEPRMVALSDVAPKLLLSTSPDWKAKSVWFFNVNEEFGSFETTPEITAKVKEILRGAKDEMDSVSRLTHWCGDEIRYSGISMGKGEGFTLHKGEMTFTDRCGVCKDKAGMLITMLRAAGFKSYPAMTMAGSRIDYIPADQFNHCVTVVKLRDGRYHLLDPTWVPFVRELWSSAEQQQEYLMGIPEGADLATTPVSPPENHFVKIDGVSELTADGSLRGRITITAEGQSDAALRGLLRNAPKTTWFNLVEREILKVWPQARVSQVRYSDPNDYLGMAIWMAIDYVIPEFALVSGNQLFFTPLGPAGIFRNYQGQLSFETGMKERKYPFRDRCSRQVEINESIQLPPLREVVRMPAAVALDGDVASFKAAYGLKGTTLVFNSTAKFGKRIYETSDWPAFRRAVEAQKRLADQPVIIQL